MPDLFKLGKILYKAGQKTETAPLTQEPKSIKQPITLLVPDGIVEQLPYVPAHPIGKPSPEAVPPTQFELAMRRYLGEIEAATAFLMGFSPAAASKIPATNSRPVDAVLRFLAETMPPAATIGYKLHVEKTPTGQFIPGLSRSSISTPDSQLDLREEFMKELANNAMPLVPSSWTYNTVSLITSSLISPNQSDDFGEFLKYNGPNVAEYLSIIHKWQQKLENDYQIDLYTSLSRPENALRIGLMHGGDLGDNFWRLLGLSGGSFHNWTLLSHVYNSVNHKFPNLNDPNLWVFDRWLQRPSSTLGQWTPFFIYIGAPVANRIFGSAASTVTWPVALTTIATSMSEYASKAFERDQVTNIIAKDDSPADAFRKGMNAGKLGYFWYLSFPAYIWELQEQAIKQNLLNQSDQKLDPETRNSFSKYCSELGSLLDSMSQHQAGLKTAFKRLIAQVLQHDKQFNDELRGLTSDPIKQAWLREFVVSTILNAPHLIVPQDRDFKVIADYLREHTSEKIMTELLSEALSTRKSAPTEAMIRQESDIIIYSVQSLFLSARSALYKAIQQNSLDLNNLNLNLQFARGGGQPVELKIPGHQLREITMLTFQDMRPLEMLYTNLNGLNRWAIADQLAFARRYPGRYYFQTRDRSASVIYDSKQLEDICNKFVNLQIDMLKLYPALFSNPQHASFLRGFQMGFRLTQDKQREKPIMLELAPHVQNSLDLQILLTGFPYPVIVGFPASLQPFEQKH